MLTRALLAAVSLVTLSACEAEATKPSGPTTTPTNSQQGWLCGREYVNHAWGYQRRGVVLDVSGTFWTYSVTGNGDLYKPVQVMSLTEADLKKRYNGATIVMGKKVSGAEIEKYFPLINDAAQAKPTEPAPRGADMGQTLVYCYTYDATAGTYSQVMLDNKGDWTSTNPSQAAKNLTSWLNNWFKDIN